MPVQVQLFGHRLECPLHAAPPHVEGKPLGVEGILREPIEPFALHQATGAASDAPHMHFQHHPRVAAGQIAYPSPLAVVPAHLGSTAAAAHLFWAPRERDHAQLRIAEQPSNRGLYPETGKGVRIQHSPLLDPVGIASSSENPQATPKPASLPMARLSALPRVIRPTQVREDPTIRAGALNACRPISDSFCIELLAAGVEGYMHIIPPSERIVLIRQQQDADAKTII